MDFEGIL